ncbi:MAG: hydrogenase iron-sulfur subunit [Chloroflexi bacterium]|nr:hydrogenase iron-sulfur subunit [Chloroflexota bacterium]
MQRLSPYDPNFKDEVMAEPGGEHLLRCYSCGTCVSMCLVSRVSSEFNPRRTMRMVMLGMREQVFSNPTIWMCSACDLCYPHCPQGIHISELMRAIKNIAVREGYEPPGPVAVVNEEECSGCDVCEKACPYGALSLVAKEADGRQRKVSQVNKMLCMTCGICAAACPLAAITVEEYSNEKVAAQIQASNWLSGTTQLPPGEPRLLVFNCSWNLRADTDREALTRFPPNVRVIVLPCSGRVDPIFILLALKSGVDGVLVAGCQPGQCHYKQGTRIAQGRMQVLQQILKQMGIDSGRVRFAQIGTEERGRFPALVMQMVSDLKAQMEPAKVTA